MSAFSSDLVDKCWKRDWNGLTDCLLQGHPVNQVDSNGFTSLQVCAALGWTSALSVLLKYGADIHARSPLGWTALMQAVRNGHSDTTEVLLEAGANVSDKNSLGWDVISIAVASNNDSLLMKLVQQTKESDFSSALLIACQIGNVNAVKFLIKQEVDINYKVPISELTPLMLAAAEGHERVVEVLLHHKANPHATNSYNLTASDVALMNSKHTIVEMLSHLMKPQVPLKRDLSFAPHYLSIPQLPDKPVSPYPHNQMNFYLPMHLSPVVGPTSPQIFLYPPPQTPSHSPYLNPIGFGGTSPLNSFPYSPVYLVPPTCHCNSPCASSPLIPAWMFSPWQRKNSKERTPAGKASKSFKKWWSKLKRRCNGKRQRKKFRVHVTHGYGKGGEVMISERKLEEVLSVLNLNYLAPLLKSHEIDLETFTQLRDSDLEELGIADKALQLSILQKISSLKGNLDVGAL